MFNFGRKQTYAGSHSSDSVYLSGKEVFLDTEKTIVSKTTPTGLITYANEVFIEISGFAEKELIGFPHSIVRHPRMPRCIFKLLWDTIGQGTEIFAYVINRCKNGDHYWVLAHVTPSYDLKRQLIGYHSSRRAPRREAIRQIEPLYQELVETERLGRKEGLEAATEELKALLLKKKMTYDKFVLSI